MKHVTNSVRLLGALTVALSLLSGLVAGQSFSSPSFYSAVPGGPGLMAAGDVDGDGDQDLVVAPLGGSLLRVLLNNGSGAFSTGTSMSAGSLISGLVLGDLNGDGNLDVVSASNTTAGGLQLRLGNGAGGFSASAAISTTSNPRTIRLADFDLDGDLDLVYAAFPGEILFNNGAGAFPTRIPNPATGVMSGLFVDDINGDGDPDILATVDNGFNDDRLYQIRSAANGTFVSSFSSIGNANGVPCVLGDLNGSGALEAVIGQSGSIEVFTIPASNSFTSQGATSTGGSSTTIPTVADIDGDGNGDVIAQDGPGEINILLGDGALGFPNTVTLSTGGLNPGFALVEDLNGDGALDIVGTKPGTGEIAVFLQVASASFNKPMLTEASWASPDFVEITNFQSNPLDLTGYQVLWKDGSTVTSAPLSETLQPGESLVVVESGGSVTAFPTIQVNNTALPNIVTASGDFVVALRSPAGVIVDEVRVSATSGSYFEGSLGGSFRGVVDRTGASGSSGSAERIWGLDSNAGADWTFENVTSPGLESRSSGPRGTDPLPLETILITEVDDSPDLIEIYNPGSTAVDLAGWFFLCNATQGGPHTRMEPFAGISLAPGEYMVIGEVATPPAEMPAGTQYVDTLENIPWNSEEYDCALYDRLGRLVDMLRTTGNDDEVTHNHPRAPSAWNDFLGAAGRLDGNGDDAIGRVNLTDTDTGADFAPVFTRTMGMPNSGFAAFNGHAAPLDFRANNTALGGGLTMIINAGPAMAGMKYSIFPSYVRTFGEGPFLGLGMDALNYWFLLNNVAPWGGTLDATGSLRFDYPALTFPPGALTDVIAILQDPVTGAFLGRTLVLEWDA